MADINCKQAWCSHIETRRELNVVSVDVGELTSVLLLDIFEPYKLFNEALVV